LEVVVGGGSTEETKGETRSDGGCEADGENERERSTKRTRRARRDGKMDEQRSLDFLTNVVREGERTNSGLTIILGLRFCFEAEGRKS